MPMRMTKQQQAEHAITVWQPRTPRRLSEEDAREITENLSGFFSLLTKWEQAETPTPANDPYKPVAPIDEGVRHDC